ncbi:MAG: ImmA/IrrE family metallo-endopeptidase, partial [Solirubrobacteraceae bacterium]
MTAASGTRIRHLREVHGLSQAELARRLGLSASYLNQIERDHRPLTTAVLLRLTESFGVDPTFFAAEDTPRLIAELQDALLDDAVGVRLSGGELADLAARHPEVARGLIGLRRRYRDVSAGQGLAELDPGRAPGGDAGTVVAPHELVRDFVYDHQNYFPVLDEAAESLATALDLQPGDGRVAFARHLRDRHGVRVVQKPSDASDGELRRFDADAHTLQLAAQLRPGQQAFQLATQIALLEHGGVLDELAASDRRLAATPQAARLARLGLAHYFAGAALMPYRRFLGLAREYRYDVERLGDLYRVGFEVVCHRLSTLQRPGLRGVPFSFVRVDRAGNISKRQSASGLH